MINWKIVPALRFFLPLAAGILVAHYTAIVVPYLGWFLALGIAPLLYLTYQRGITAAFWRFGIVLNVLVFGFGYWLVGHHDLRRQADFLGNHLVEQQRATIYGYVADPPVLKNDRYAFTLDVSARQDSLQTVAPATGRVLIRAQVEHPPSYGDAVTVRAYLNPIGAPSNPEAFDYQRYLALKGIYHQAYVDSEGFGVVSVGSSGYGVLHWANGLRKHLVASLRSHLDDAKTFSVGSALILGYKDEMDSEIRDAYAATGAMHVLAVSGLHVGIIYLLLSFLFKRWLEPYDVRWRVGKLPFVLLGIWAFVFVTGASPSVLRAGTMFSFVCVGEALRKERFIYNTLASSALVLLLVDPMFLFSVGFQLSYAAVLGIVYLQPKLAAWWQPTNKILRFVWELLLVSVAAQLVTLPLSLHYFHQFPIYFLLSGLIVVPAAMIILPLGLVTLAASFLPIVANVVGALLNKFIQLVNWCILTIQELPHATVDGFWVPGLVVVLLYLSYAGWVHSWANHRVRGVLFSLLLFVVIGSFYAFTTVSRSNTKQMIFYQTRGGVLIDCFAGYERYTFRSDSLDERSASYAANNYRTKYGPHVSQTFHLSNTPGSYNQLAVRGGAFHFGSVTVLMVDQALPAEVPKHIDYLFLINGTQISPTDLKLLNPKQIILDAGFPWRIHQTWKRTLTELGLPFHSLRESGALTVPL